MDLPTDLALQFKDKIERIELESKMRYVTSIERILRQEAVEEGLEKGVLAGQILLLQQLIGDKTSTVDELKLLSIDQLTPMLSRLQNKLDSRGNQ